MNSNFFLILGIGLVCGLGIACAYSMKAPKKEVASKELVKEITKDTSADSAR